MALGQGRPRWKAGALLLLGALALPAGAQAPDAGAAAPMPAPPALAPEALDFIDTAIAEGRLASAQEQLSRARARSDAPALQLREAELLLASGALPQAIIVFDRLAADPALAAAALTGRGIAELRAGRLDAADASLAAALAAGPVAARALSARGVIADRRRDWAAAERHYGAALALAPQSAMLFNNRGYSRLLQGRHADAEADFQRAMQLAPALATARTNLRFARALQGRYGEAFAQSSREALPADLNTVGFAAMVRGDLALAESYFARALDIDRSWNRAAAANLAWLQAQRTEPRP
jgi:Flp pilus assembly protein TadD